MRGIKTIFHNCFKFSYSDYKNYHACPYRFFLIHTLKSQKIYPRAVNSRMFMNGWCAHKCLELWNTHGHFANNWMFDVVISCDIDKFHTRYNIIERNEKSANLVREIIKEFMFRNNVLFSGNDNIETAYNSIESGLHTIEYWMQNWNLCDEYTQSEHKFEISLKSMNIIVKGSVDLIDHKIFDIYDMKFSTAKYIDWKQLLWYDLMLSLEMNKKVRCTHTFNPLNNDGVLEDKENSKQDLADFAEEIANTVNKIRNLEFDARIDSRECFHCSAAQYCEHNLYNLKGSK